MSFSVSRCHFHNPPKKWRMIRRRVSDSASKINEFKRHLKALTRKEAGNNNNKNKKNKKNKNKNKNKKRVSMACVQPQEMSRQL